ncbi:DUF4861 domain-containing protein [Gilvimarinus agarilyticus]|uniref:DUF4861 family protein n=1 Tax=Gilvimarinus sp. 2_MG-2023 TaxID=3062666 RepID=UPI001C0A2C10|nr:DUF4861 family protein [Gilvimarinus sp. 2_MG-2023]MBU2886715.1 DUF4861 domain-containing protein [Gilvimarinus agarilyticus]MDO6571381.1 DUF4861 family protein [Gilvimarinus sp. 2_MG-2023]
MLRLTTASIAAGIALLSVPCLATPATETVSYYSVENPLSQARKEVISLHLNSLAPNRDSVVIINGEEAPSQTAGDKLLVQVKLPAETKQTLAVHQLNDGSLQVDYPAQTYAELAVRVGGETDKEGNYSGGRYHNAQAMQLPATHTIGNKLFKYEGFGWESEQVGYRYYFDERGAIDIFGKQQNGLSLAHTGLDGGDYHSMADWGMDILKVGPSLGLGAVGAWLDNRLVKPEQVADMSVTIATGPLESSATVTHGGWSPDSRTVDLTTRYSIRANSYLTRVDAQAGDLEQLATGIVDHGVQVLTHTPDDGKWGYLATYGTQSLNDDKLGMAIFFPINAFDSFQQDEHNQLVILNNSAAGAHYYFGAFWSAHPQGPKTIEQFKVELANEIDKLNSPIRLKPTNP